MPIIIFDVTDDDYILFFESKSFKFFRQKVEPYVAYFYQVRLDDEMFIHEVHSSIKAS